VRETWYVMADGTVGDPREIRADADGVLRHSDGRAVAYAPHGPRSRSVDVEALQARPAEPVAPPVPPAAEAPAREIRPAGGGPTYRTRGARSK